MGNSNNRIMNHGKYVDYSSMYFIVDYHGNNKHGEHGEQEQEHY